MCGNGTALLRDVTIQSVSKSVVANIGDWNWYTMSTSRSQNNMRPADRIALTLMAEIVREHLQAGEDRRSLDVLPSDRMQGVIDYLLEGADLDINEETT